MSTAMIGLAPARAEPAIAATPTPPQPMTATDLPRVTAPVLIAAPTPAITPQPSRPTAAGRASGSTLVHCPAATRVFSAKAPIPRAGESSVPASGPSARVIFCLALWVLKQYSSCPRLHARHSPQTARQLSTTKSPGATPVTSGTHRLDDPGGLVAQQERELVVDPALAVVQVGVAHPAGLDLHHGLARTGVRHVDRGDLDGCALGTGDDGLDLLHVVLLRWGEPGVTRGRVRRYGATGRRIQQGWSSS